MTPNLIWDAVAGFARSVNAILSFIPALVWAIALALAAGYGSLMHHERDHAVSERNVVQASYEQLSTKVIRLKNEAAALLKQLTAERDALQVQINHARDEQEKKDAKDKKTIADQAARIAALDAAAPGGQLRDPNGSGCGRAGPEGVPAAVERGGEEHGAAPGGLLSAPVSRLLREQAADSDKWGRLYGLARADALMCRQAQAAP